MYGGREQGEGNKKEAGSLGAEDLWKYLAIQTLEIDKCFK